MKDSDNALVHSMHPTSMGNVRDRDRGLRLAIAGATPLKRRPERIEDVGSGR